ncbi:MAG: hypothetical protein KDE26_28570, partial [Bacteroidetes bacterium]|nr:hypothetical protein [Bacteroidota bacterium]
MIVLILGLQSTVFSYPIDGYLFSGIRRVLRLQLILNGELKDTPPIKGAQKSIADIKLNLLQTPKGDSLTSLPEPDPDLQKALSSVFPNLHESYSIALMDITPGRPIRYASRQESRGFQPGSVGKLAVITGLFCELETIFPDSFEQRIELIKNKMVR